jgi:hypothetical protein
LDANVFRIVEHGWLPWVVRDTAYLKSISRGRGQTALWAVALAASEFPSFRVYFIMNNVRRLPCPARQMRSQAIACIRVSE